MTTVALTLAQWLITSKLFYARNYLFLLPYLCLVAAIGWTQVTGKLSIPLGLAMLIGCIIPFTSLGSMTEVDLLLTDIHANTQQRDGVIVGCCVEEPIAYELHRSGEDDLRYFPNKDRLFIVTTETDSLEDLLNLYGISTVASTCKPDPTWTSFVVYQCVQ
jgi:hypothetical protein